MATPEFDLAGAMRLRHGRLVVGDAAFAGGQVRLVTAMLLMDRAAPVPVDRLTDALWPSGPPAQFRAALRGLVSKVRGFLVDVGIEGERIHSRPGRYVVDLPDLAIDIELARVDLDLAREALRDGVVEEARDRAAKARAVLSRPLLPGVDAGWLDRLRETSGTHLLESMLVVGECRLRLGQVAGARSLARQALELEPLREDAWRLAMRVEHHADNTAAALELYEHLRERLGKALGVDPSTATRDLHTRLLRNDPGPDDPRPDDPRPDDPRRDDPRPGDQQPATTAPSAGPRVRDVDGSRTPIGDNPYVGLRSFERHDADLFFGREADVQQLLDRLAAKRGVAVVGPSGVGKSSLVRAGLLPALAAGGLPDADLWRVIVMRPGPDPARELARHLARGRASERRVDEDPLAATIVQDPVGLQQLLSASDGDATGTTLVVVDQAEELFTLVDDRRTSRFIDALVTAVAAPRSPLVLVITLRVDFYERAARHVGLADFLSTSQFLVSPLQGDGLQLAITEPARRTGIGLEDGVLGRLVGEAGTDPSGLPLLQHALWRLWHQAEDGRMTLRTLESMGGVAGALVEHAEQAWLQLDVRQRRIARTILLRGVAPSVAGATAAPVTRSDLDELGPAKVVDGVVAALVGSRLVTTWRQDITGRAMLQLSHEALVSAWPRLGGWVDAQRAHLQVAARLATAAEQWAAQQRHDDWLLTGRRLDDALDLAAAIDAGSIDVVLSATEAAFVSASTQARAARREQEADRRAHEDELQDQVVRHLRVGQALLAADNALPRDADRTLLLCLAVADEIRSHTPQHEATWLRLLHQGVANQRLLGRLPGAGPLLAVLPDGRLVTCTIPDPDAAGADTHAAVDLVDRHTGEVDGTIRGLGSARPTVAHIDTTGTVLAIGATDGRIHLVDLDTLDVTEVIQGPDTLVGSVALSPGGTQVAGLWFRDDTRQLVVHDTRTGAAIHGLHPVAQPHGSEAFPVGHQLDFHPSQPRLVATTGPRHAVLQLLDTDTWTTIAEHHLASPIRHVEHSPDGSQIGTSHHFGASTHDAMTLDRDHHWRIGAKYPTTAWTKDGSGLVSAGDFLRRLDPQDRRPRALPPRRGRSPALDGLRDDRVLLAVPGTTEMVTGRQGAPGIRRWDIGGDAGPEVIRLTGAGRSAGNGAWSPDGHRLATVHGAAVVIWNVDPWHERARQLVTDAPTPGGVGIPGIENLAWSRDGTDVLVPASGGIFVVLDGDTAAITHVRNHPPSFFTGDTDASLDGNWVVATHGPRIEILDRQYSVVQRFESRFGSQVEAAAFSPDGSWLATTHWPTATLKPGAQGATVWDWRTGEVVAFRAGVANNLSWSPDGTTLAVSLQGRTVVWDVEGDTVVHQLVGHRGWVQDVAHNPDGTTIATGGFDGDVRLWDAATGRQSLHLTGDEQVHRLAFHPNRPWLAVGKAHGEVHVWTLDTDELLDIARSRVTRELRGDERERFLATSPGELDGRMRKTGPTPAG